MEPALVDLFRRLRLATAERRLDALERALGQQQASPGPAPLSTRQIRRPG